MEDNQLLEQILHQLQKLNNSLDLIKQGQKLTISTLNYNSEDISSAINRIKITKGDKEVNIDL